MLRPLFFAAIAALTIGCSVLPPVLPPATVHDLGAPSETQSLAPPCDPVVAVSAPDWLDDGAILYRPDQGTQLAAYRDHRWVAPPSALLSERLRGLLPAPKKEGQPRCWLDLSITAFEQGFTVDGNATAMIAARARLSAGRAGPTLASADFMHREPSLTPDVQGGIPSLAAAMKALAEQVAAWLVNVAQEAEWE